MHQTLVNNRYAVGRVLGTGGMAKVYLAHDGVLARDVALKMLREQYAEDEEFATRFEREALNAASLSHPHIVGVFDRGEAEDGTPYIAMEYVAGGTLKDRIARDGPLEPGVAAAVGAQIAEALNEAHSNGVVHRDIKPQNVLVTGSGDVKVADFGIARAAGAATVSQTSVVLGTASYMSPEQALGRPATHKSDLYSLGVVLYEMLTGEPPYAAESPVAVSMKHVNEPVRGPREVDPRVPEGMNALVEKLLAKNPDDRYTDAAGLAEDLRRVRDGLSPAAAGVVAGNPGPAPGAAPGATRETVVAPRPARAAGRNRRLLAALVGVLALLALLGGAGWALSGGEEPPAASEKAGEVAGAKAATAEVPSVEGLTRQQAVEELDASGFEADVRSRESSEAEVDEVLAQSPAGGEKAQKGSRVALEVGDGPADVGVPDLVGSTVAEARGALGEAGLSVGQRRGIPSNTASEGTVVEQGFPAGTKVEPGTAVNLGVSSGPEQNAVGTPKQDTPPTEDASNGGGANASGGDAAASASASAASSAGSSAPASGASASGASAQPSAQPPEPEPDPASTPAAPASASAQSSASASAPASAGAEEGEEDEEYEGGEGGED